MFVYGHIRCIYTVLANPKHEPNTTVDFVSVVQPRALICHQHLASDPAQQTDARFKFVAERYNVQFTR